MVSKSAYVTVTTLAVYTHIYYIYTYIIIIIYIYTCMRAYLEQKKTLGLYWKGRFVLDGGGIPDNCFKKKMDLARLPLFHVDL